MILQMGTHDTEERHWTLRINTALVIEACIILVSTFLIGATYGMRRTLEMLQPRVEECISQGAAVEALVNRACPHDQ